MSLLDGLISYWRLDEASGTRYDAHGSNDLTDENTVGSGTGILGSAASLTAASSEGLSISTAALNPGTSDFSVSLWLWAASLPGANRAAVSKGCTDNDATNSKGFSILTMKSAGGIFAGIGDGSAARVFYQTNVAIPTAEWFHVAVTADRDDKLRVFVNASELGNVTISAQQGSINPSAAFAIGRYSRNSGSPSHYYDGAIDEIGVWHRLLTPAEITEMYNAGNGLAYPFGIVTSQPQPIWFM